MTNLFIDTEFNGFGGELISMAIVDGFGNNFYEVLEIKGPLDAWVDRHVVPVLQQDAITLEQFQVKLQEYLFQFDHITLIADWPDDIRYFCEVLITGPGEMLIIPTFTVKMMRKIKIVSSAVPHNALADAFAIMKSYNQLEGK